MKKVKSVVVSLMLMVLMAFPAANVFAANPVCGTDVECTMYGCDPTYDNGNIAVYTDWMITSDGQFIITYTYSSCGC